MKNEVKIFLASPRGFCAGVERAIDIVEKTITKFGSPVYVRHEIVHNKQVVENLKKKGTIFVEELSEVKDLTRPVIFSAHGVPKKVPEEAKIKNLFYIDATCPLVSKVHRESEQLNKNGYDIILIGHKNHPEVVGTMGQLPSGSISLIETVDEVKNLGIPFGFKANLWKNEPLPVHKVVKISDDGFGENPVDVLGSRDDYSGEKFCDFSKRMLNKGATILGGCCEVKPSHINAIAKLKQI